ncbi:MAG: hypothetical protein HY646_22055 [Acidobacteria bacterium]|nr:hypothetical protein [Acidobacteriota bacterium]
MRTVFTEREAKVIRRIQQQPAQTIAQIRASCPQHSVCTPLPLFRVYKVDDQTFEAQWNGYHEAGIKQTFRFEEVLSRE